MNNMKVFLMMAGLTALFGVLGNWWAGESGMVIALLFAGVMNFVMYWTSSTMVLRMYGAKVVSPNEAPELYQMVDRLRQRAGLPMPTVAIAPHQQPNAFATGRNPEHAVVCVTQGLLELVPPAELEGGTFTVSNLGMFGVTHFIAVINPPQAGILAVGAIEERAVVRDGELVARRMMTATLTCDHRILYGADAAAFLADIRTALEEPLRIAL